MAAIMAARNGAAVTVLEQNENRKEICATGNGRCNFPILQDRMMHTEANIGICRRCTQRVFCREYH